MRVPIVLCFCNMRALFRLVATSSNIYLPTLTNRPLLLFCSPSKIVSCSTKTTSVRVVHSRLIKQKQEQEQKQKQIYDEEPITYASVEHLKWDKIYQFPMIIPVRIFSRFKMYLTVISVLSVPNALYHSLYGSLPQKEMWFITSVCLFSTCLMYAFGQLFRRMIGSIYISPDKKLVRISHLTFFGNRQESVYRVDDILPLADCNQDMQSILLRVTTEQSANLIKNSLFMSLRFGGITDNDNFVRVFGPV